MVLYKTVVAAVLVNTSTSLTVIIYTNKLNIAKYIKFVTSIENVTQKYLNPFIDNVNDPYMQQKHPRTAQMPTIALACETKTSMTVVQVTVVQLSVVQVSVVQVTVVQVTVVQVSVVQLSVM